MAAGSQAQGSWQNTKGNKVEIIVKRVFQRHLREHGLVAEETADGSRMKLKDGRLFIFRDEPDIAIYEEGAKSLAQSRLKAA